MEYTKPVILAQDAELGSFAAACYQPHRPNCCECTHS